MSPLPHVQLLKPLLQGCTDTYCRVFTVIAGETLVQIMSKQSYSKLNPREKYYCKH